MIITLNSNNCYMVGQLDDTHEWFLEFKKPSEIDNLIYDLNSLKTALIKQQQKEFDNKYQLTLKL